MQFTYEDKTAERDWPAEGKLATEAEHDALIKELGGEPDGQWRLDPPNWRDGSEATDPELWPVRKHW